MQSATKGLLVTIACCALIALWAVMPHDNCQELTHDLRIARRALQSITADKQALQAEAESLKKGESNALRIQEDNSRLHKQVQRLQAESTELRRQLETAKTAAAEKAAVKSQPTLPVTNQEQQQEVSVMDERSDPARDAEVVDAKKPTTHASDAQPVDAACRQKQADYYASHWNTTALYTDEPLEAMWKNMDGKWPFDCKGGGAVIDVGAHMGDQVEYWLHNFGGSSCKSTTVYLFEPNPITYSDLAATIRKVRSKTNRVVPTRAAVSNYTGTTKLFFNRGNRPNKGKNQMASLGKVRGEAAASGGGTDVQVVTVDSFLQSEAGKGRPVDNIYLLKIDTEGFDATVLYGAEKSLEKVRFLAYECHKLWHSGSGDRLANVVPWLEARGFRSIKVGNPYFLRLAQGLFHPIYDELINWQNCLAFRPNDPVWENFKTLC
eukprot:NODE_490_length_1446_cov_14.483700_g456_i0.p1 GENE.NODE_490_length_1446_cov_14.483700_g456_i0~~NODE_490_length_1446_cov_14.483700_g456_i0.p1  ORF type:complete len:436 (+),score=63.40 NODE_490_length_1446_cov_14.483700_g456_i0:89-1396(+)